MWSQTWSYVNLLEATRALLWFGHSNLNILGILRPPESPCQCIFVSCVTNWARTEMYIVAYLFAAVHWTTHQYINLSIFHHSNGTVTVGACFARLGLADRGGHCPSAASSLSLGSTRSLWNRGWEEAYLFPHSVFLQKNVHICTKKHSKGKQIMWYFHQENRMPWSPQESCPSSDN